MQHDGRARFPQARPRRLRRTETLRRMVRETRLSVDSLIYPLFVVPGADVRVEITSMPGVYHFSVDRVVEEAREVADLGIPAVILFGLPRHKDEQGSEAWAADGVVQQALRAIKRAVPSLVLMADTCLCEYTSHGHCGIPGPDSQPGFIDNDRSLELLVRAVSPAIVELRQFGELVRTGELRRAAARLKNLTPEELAAVDAVTAGIVNKLLHGPTVALRDSAVQPGSLQRSRSLVLERVLRLNRHKGRPARGRSA